MTTPGTCWTYVIECEDGTLYSGSSKDPEARFRTHAGGRNGAARYFRARKPVRILGKKEFPDRAAAYRMELVLKRLSPWEKREWAHIEGGGPDPGPQPENDRKPPPRRRRRTTGVVGTSRRRRVRLKTVFKNVCEEMAAKFREEDSKEPAAGRQENQQDQRGRMSRKGESTK
jgi:putative endonuclease